MRQLVFTWLGTQHDMAAPGILSPGIFLVFPWLLPGSLLHAGSLSLLQLPNIFDALTSVFPHTFTLLFKCGLLPYSMLRDFQTCRFVI